MDTRARVQVLGTNHMGYQTGQAMREVRQNPRRRRGTALGWERELEWATP